MLARVFLKRIDIYHIDMNVNQILILNKMHTQIFCEGKVLRRMQFIPGWASASNF